MKRGSLVFLQIVIVLVGAGALALLLWEPHLEGVNARATTLHEIYFDDPFLMYVYIASIPFFVALYQAFKLLGYMARDVVFSHRSVYALRTIKYCALTLVGFLLGAEGYLFFVQRKIEEDVAGGVMMGLLLIFISLVVAAAAAVFERELQSAIKIKSENDLLI